MTAILNIQDHYRCYQCKAAEDIYGRLCKYGMLFPLGLLLSNIHKCPNFEYDVEKTKENLSKKEESK